MALIGKIVLFIVGAFVFQVALSGFSRKVIARIQKRRGPVFWQNFYDIGKLFFKKTSISHGFIFDFGVWMAFGGTVATLLFVPVGPYSVFPGQTNFIVIIYLLAIGSLGMAMSAVGSANPYASMGISRALTQMFGYDVPFALTVVIMIYVHRTSQVAKLAAIQSDIGWHLWVMPLSALVAFIALMAMMGKKPFDTPIAPAEIASGPLVEYSGKYLGMLMVQHEFATFVEVGLFVNLFLGGGSTLLVYLVKYIIVYLLTVIISALMARFRVEQTVAFFWKWPLVLVFIQALIIIGIGIR
ncbi:MAG TPA: NADH-quinone oxidoreductase subunit H [Candidatus Mcinerneyibacteriales bacterium]|nr:NADH-quinone oxidoreductase subunit H [Candidatus Mcinerneyibacteriales bacterium]